jgi:hypothetical protein
MHHDHEQVPETSKGTDDLSTRDAVERTRIAASRARYGGNLDLNKCTFGIGASRESVEKV